MRSATLAWIWYALSALVLIGTLGWVSFELVGLERERRVAQAQTLHNQQLRLAVWRIDSMLSPVLAGEAARPHFHYQAFYSPALAYTRLWEEIDRNEVFVPSPILSPSSAWIRLHFQLTRKGVWSSPQVPAGNMLDRALASGLSQASMRRRRKELEGFEQQRLAARLWQALGRAGQQRGDEFLALLVDNGQLATVDAPVNNDWRVQRRAFNRQVVQNVNSQRNTILVGPRTQRSAVKLRRSPLVPVWLAGSKDLFMVRQVNVGKQQLLQGLAIDWPLLESLARSEVADIFPRARLMRREADDRSNLDSLISILPAKLDPGEMPTAPPADWTPMKIGLAVAWGCLGLALLTVAGGLRGMLRLNARRLEFVSAVTHELRTPLTTFQLYTDMLVEGMVTDEATRATYLETLRGESLRLSHLVQNVLEYSRLEDRRWQPTLSELTLGGLLEHCRTSLEERCARGDMQLVVDCALPLETSVTTDASAVGQILFNLVDNACKYASQAELREVTLRISGPKPLCFEVIDHGPGMPAGEIKRLLQPFQRGRQAESPQPGIGLGLSLAQRWARQFGGDVSAKAGPGGRFILRLG